MPARCGAYVSAWAWRVPKDLLRREATPEAKAYGCEEPSKSLCRRHGRDWLAALSRWSLYWNCARVRTAKLKNVMRMKLFSCRNPGVEHFLRGYDDGVFIGGRGSGKGLHVDQVRVS